MKYKRGEKLVVDNLDENYTVPIEERPFQVACFYLTTSGEIVECHKYKDFHTAPFGFRGKGELYNTYTFSDGSFGTVGTRANQYVLPGAVDANGVAVFDPLTDEKPEVTFEARRRMLAMLFGHLLAETDSNDPERATQMANIILATPAEDWMLELVTGDAE